MSLDERLAAVERALTDGEVEPAALSDAATVERRLGTIEDRLDSLEQRLAAAEAGVGALRGQAGEARRETDQLERTTEQALATARAVEARLDENPTETSAPRPEPVVREPEQSRLFDRLRDWL